VRGAGTHRDGRVVALTGGQLVAAASIPTLTARDGEQAGGVLLKSRSAFLLSWRRARSRLRDAATAGDWVGLTAHPAFWVRATACCGCKLAGWGVGPRMEAEPPEGYVCVSPGD